MYDRYYTYKYREDEFSKYSDAFNSDEGEKEQKMKGENTAKWQRELKSFLGIKSGVILEGNTLDEFLYENKDEIEFLSLDMLIHEYGEEISAEVVYYSPLQGFYCYENGYDEMPFLASYLDGYICNMMQELAPGGHDAYMPVEVISNARVSKGGEDKKNIITQYDSCSGANNTADDSFKQVNMSKIVLRAMLNAEPRYEEETSDILSKSKYPSKIFVLNFASRLEHCNLDKPAETEMFMNLHFAINNAKSSVLNDRKNMIILVVDKYNDIPAWLYLNNPNMRTFYIESPDRKTRRLYMPFAVRKYEKYQVLSQLDNKMSEEFVAETGGLLCSEIKQLINLASNEEIETHEIKKAIKMYKYGLKESPWEELEEDIIERLSFNLDKRVKGQDIALDRVKKVIMRSVKGLSGLQHSNADNKPRGILFFAGPTGVGKTETAKAIAETIFGDEDACIRFDMSEYRMEQSEQKIFGAPPGYVGYEGGGQLTNAVKNHPFSVLLFDEIEKAHPSIMDKFLQILEDGRMTDNQGNTVYFSESIIIFTSNIGLTEPAHDVSGNEIRRATISIENPFDDDTTEFKKETNRIVKEGVKNYFVNIGRPELLNRLGENNIVVFSFIDKWVAEIICAHQVENIMRLLKQKLDIAIDVEEIRSFLYHEAILQRENGGRGIGNMLEEKLINPLAEYICDYKGRLTNIRCTLDENENKLILEGK